MSGNYVPNTTLVISSNILSPCIDVCQINRQTRLCDGCGRTIDEITNWSKMTDNERLLIMKKNTNK